jgi:Methylase involved in ubiquinone/menaquinone biosynthesis
MVSVFANPKQILLDRLKLKRDMAAADFGCGSGEWAAALARILDHGKVWAIDLLEEPLSAAKSRAKIAGLENIEFVRGDIEKLVPQLPADSLDLVLMTNLLFQVGDRNAVFNEAKRVLKTGGRVVAIDWKATARVGPAEKLPPEEIKDAAARAGFEAIGEFDAGSFHYGLIFEKQ